MSKHLAWEELAGLAVLLGGLGAVVAFGDQLTFWPGLALFALFVLTLSILFRRGWLKVLGPIAVHELIRVTRRSRFVLYRLYAYFMLILLALFYAVWSIESDQTTWTMKVRAQEMAEFAAGFVLTFLALQLLLLAVLTPAYTAGGLAEEKERGTLEFLLATDLRNREIVLSKVTARLANLFLTMLTGVPIVCFLQFLGGVDPFIVLTGFVATAATMLGLAGLGVLNSVYARKPRNAIVMTFLEAAAYMVLTYALPHVLIGTGYASTTILGLGSFTVADAIYWFEAGNPITLLTDAVRGLQSATRMAATLPAHVRDFTLFHLAVAAICITWASLRLREVFRRQVYEQAGPVGKKRRRAPRRIGPWPMVWKEVIAEPGLRLAWFGRIVMFVLVAGSFAPVITEIVDGMMRVRFFSFWARGVGSLVACLLLLRVAVHASTALTSERERQTFDGLLTTPLSAKEILFGKWLGSVTSVRWGWLWLGSIWAIGVAADLRPLAVILLIAAWWIYAAVLGVVGLWFSLRSPSSLRATVLTLLVACGLWFSYVLSFPVLVRLPSWHEQGPVLRFINHYQAGMSPMLVFAWLLAFDRDGRLPEGNWEIPMALAGLATWAVGGGVLWFLLLRRFREQTGRETGRRAEGEPESLIREFETKPAALSPLSPVGERGQG